MALGTGVHNLSLVVRAHNRASRALAGVSRDLSLMDKTRQTVQRGFSRMSNVGALAIKTLAIAVAGAVAASIFAFSSFDAALTTSLAIVEEVSPEIRKELSDTAREVAKTTIFSANEAAAAYFHLFSAGQDVAQAMRNLPVVAAFAQAGLFDLEVATELLVTSQNALGLAFEDPIKNAAEMARIADVLAAADERAVGSIEDFAEALTNRAAAAMRTYGIEVEEGVAVLAAWATQGLKGRTAGEAFSIVVRDLQKAALAEADAWREVNAAVFDSEDNLRDMADIIKDLEDAMLGLSDAQKKQLLTDLGFQERSQARLLQLLGTSDAIREFEAAFLKAGGTTQRVAEKQLQTAWKQLGLLKDSIVDVFIGMGELSNEGFVGLIEKTNEWVNESAPRWIEAAGRVGDKVSGLIEKAQLLATHFKMVHDGQDRLNQFFLNQFGPTMQIVITFIDDVIRKWTELSQPVRDAIGDWAKMIPVIFIAAGALKIVATVLALIGGPATIVAAVIAAIAIGIKFLWENTTILHEAWAEISEFWSGTVVPALESGWEIIQTAAQITLDWFIKEMLPFIKELWAQMKETFQAGWDFVVALFDTIITILTAMWEAWGDDIIGILKFAWRIIKDVILGAWQIIEGIFIVFTAILTNDWGKLWEGLKEIFLGIWRILWSIIRNVWNAAVSFLGDIWDDLTEDWTNLWEGFKDVVKGPLNFVLGVVEGFVNKAIDILNGLIGAANKIPGVDISSIPHISIPKLAIGGDVIRSGLALVGENGPELLALGKGAQVAPLGSTQSALGGGLAGAGVGAGIHIDQVVFQGTPTQMLEDWKRYTKLALRGL